MRRPHVSKCKQSLYMKTEFLEEITAEAKRLDRSLSWIVQKVWELSREEIKKFPSEAAEATGPVTEGEE